jgi:endonuclease/exonuclease/phosphatase (EEP) superfamily protein YafD
MINRENPDIFVAQEVSDTSFSILKSKFHFSNFAPRFIRDGIVWGNSIHSQYPIIESSSIFYLGKYCDFTDRTDFENEPRNMQICTILTRMNADKELEYLNVCNNHGIWGFDPNDNPARENMVNFILKHAPLNRTLICGDFNTNLKSKCMKKLAAEYPNVQELGCSFNMAHKDVFFANFAVDAIFLSPDVEIELFKTLDDDVSDHLALMVEI